MQNSLKWRAEFSIFLVQTSYSPSCLQCTCCHTPYPYPMPPSCRLWINKRRQRCRQFLWRSLRVLRTLQVLLALNNMIRITGHMCCCFPFLPKFRISTLITKIPVNLLRHLTSCISRVNSVELCNYPIPPHHAVRFHRVTGFVALDSFTHNAFSLQTALYVKMWSSLWLQEN